MTLPQEYIKKVKERSHFTFLLGLFHRLLKWLKFASCRQLARIKGATIGRNVILPFALARKANKNLTVGHDVIIESSDIDLRGSIFIDSHCIINRDVRILRASHIIDDDTTFSTKYAPPLSISSYSWLAVGCCILPSVTRITRGSVIGSGCILAKDTEEMGVYVGNPAVLLRHHSTVFSDLIVPAMMGGDLEYYIHARFSK